MRFSHFATAAFCGFLLLPINSIAEVEQIEFCTNSDGKKTICPIKKHEFRDDDLIVMQAIVRGMKKKSNPGAESMGLSEVDESFSKMNLTELIECIRKQHDAAVGFHKFITNEYSPDYKEFKARRDTFIKDMDALKAEKDSIDINNPALVDAYNRKAEKSRIVASQIRQDGKHFEEIKALASKQIEIFDNECGYKTYTYGDFSQLPKKDRELFDESKNILAEVPKIKINAQLREKLRVK